jgi:hypothetical protein
MIHGQQNIKSIFKCFVLLSQATLSPVIHKITDSDYGIFIFIGIKIYST